MFITVHAVSGALIGDATNNLALAFVVGFLSHFLFDAVPHGDQNLLDTATTHRAKTIRWGLIGVVDATVMTALLGWLVLRNEFTFLLPTLVGAFGAILPDILSGLSMLLPWKWLATIREANHRMHYLWRGFTLSFLPGLVVQGVTLAVLLCIVFR